MELKQYHAYLKAFTPQALFGQLAAHNTAVLEGTEQRWATATIDLSTGARLEGTPIKLVQQAHQQDKGILLDRKGALIYLNVDHIIAIQVQPSGLLPILTGGAYPLV